MILYRFEFRGFGIFSAGHGFNINRIARKLAEESGFDSGDPTIDVFIHPDPVCDDGIKDYWNRRSGTKRREYFFACSFDQIKKCFPNKFLWEAMKDIDVVLCVYRCEKRFTKSSNFQVIFRKEKATKIAEFVPDWDNLPNEKELRKRNVSPKIEREGGYPPTQMAA